MSRPLRFLGLEKQFDGRTLFRIDELTLAPGRLLLITGPNGSGKTTLLKIVAGIDKPDAGEVDDGGYRCSWRRAVKRIRRQIVYLHQQAYMFDASVSDNVAYGLRRTGLARKEIRERVEAALRWAQLEALAAANARRLSGGEKQRVALARAWVLSPRFLLLDEATANLDTQSRERTAGLLRKALAEGLGVLAVTHAPQELTGLAAGHLRMEAARPENLTPAEQGTASEREYPNPQSG